MERQRERNSSGQAFSAFIRKCLEEQGDKEFILQIPLRKEAADGGQKIQA